MHQIVIIIAKYFILISPLLFLYVWLRLDGVKKIQAVKVAFLAVIFAGLLAVIGSHLFHDPRPFVAGHFTPYFPHGNDNGFPSDHTLMAGIIASVTFVYSKRFGIFAYLLALLIGLSRVIAGVHHLIDIIGALLMTIVATYAATEIVRRLTKKG